MKKAVSEILEECSKLSKRSEKIQFLKSNWNPTIGQILAYAFDPQWEFELPEGAPPYKPSEFDEYGRLYAEAKKIHRLFVKGVEPNYEKLPALKRESLFIQTLEGLYADDAKLLVAVKDKKMPYKGITKKLIMEAYPGLIKEE